jgi:hypothetical protein
VRDKRFHEVFRPWCVPVAIAFFLLAYLCEVISFKWWWVVEMPGSMLIVLWIAYLGGYRGEQVAEEERIQAYQAELEKQARRRKRNG